MKNSSQCEAPDPPGKRNQRKRKKEDNFDRILVSKRNMGEYETRVELWDQTYYAPEGTPPLEMRSCYSTTDGSYMGSTKRNFITKWVRNYGLKHIQAGPNHNIASVS